MKSYQYRGYTITMGYQWYATKYGQFVCDGATSDDVEYKIDSLLDN